MPKRMTILIFINCLLSAEEVKQAKSYLNKLQFDLKPKENDTSSSGSGVNLDQMLPGPRKIH